MADKILVSASEMRATVNRYNDARDTMDNARNCMEQALDHLNNCWKGPAWAAMMAQWALLNANIKNSDMAMARSINALNKTIEEYTEVEEENTQKWNSQEVGQDSQVYV